MWLRILLHFSGQLTLLSTTVPNLLHSPETSGALTSTLTFLSSHHLRVPLLCYQVFKPIYGTLPSCFPLQLKSFPFYSLTKNNSTTWVLYPILPHLPMNLICNLSSLSLVYLVSPSLLGPSYGYLNKLLSLSLKKKKKRIL